MGPIRPLNKKITISSIVTGLKSPLFHLFSCQVVIGQFVIRQFVIGHFNKPVTFKVVVFMNQSHSKLKLRVCALTFVCVCVFFFAA